MKKYSMLVLFFTSSVYGMELADQEKKNKEFSTIIVESASDSDQEQGFPVFFDGKNRHETRVEPKDVSEMKKVVKERSQRVGLSKKKRGDLPLPSSVIAHSQGVTVESISESVSNRPKEPVVTHPKNLSGGTHRLEGLKDSKGRDKIVPRTVSEMQKIVRSRSVQPGETPTLPSRMVPVFSQEQLEKANQYRHSKRMYTEEEVSAILHQASQNVTPLLSARFHQYGQQYNVPLQELPQYAQLLDEIVITPRLLAEFIYHKHGTTDKPEDYEVKAYEKLSKRDPEHYEKLIFGLLKEILDENDGDNGFSARSVQREFVDTHVRLLQHEIGSQSDDIFQYRVAMVVKFLALIGTTAWAIYAQVSQGSSGGLCHNTTV